MSALHDPFAEYPDDRPFAVRVVATHEHDQDALVLNVQGDVDLGTAPLLREALLLVVEHQTGPIVVDLCKVPFMDSTGVHVLLETIGRLETEHPGIAIVCRENGQVHRILGLVGVLDAVTVRRADGHRLRPDRSGNRARRHFGTDRPPPRFLPATATPEDPTIALAMARSRDPARPGGLWPSQ